MPRILSLDASSSTIGMAVMDYDSSSISLIHYEYFKPPKKGNIFERLSKTRFWIQKWVREFKPDVSAVEDIVLYMSKGSTAKTVTTLAIFNRMVGLTLLDEIGKPPFLYNALKIRHQIKPNKNLPAKEDMPELVADIIGFDFDYQMKKKRDGTWEIKEENQDMADAIACGLCHIYLDRAGLAEASQIPKKKKKRGKKKSRKSKKKSKNE